MASEDLLGFINDAWDLLPEQDKLRFGETWKAYEQTLGALWMKTFEQDLATRIDTCPLYNIQRWLQHKFDNTTQVLRSAQFRSNQDLSLGINLSTRYLIKFSVDGGTPVEVNLQGFVPSATTNLEIVNKINAAAGFTFATLVVGGALLNLQSSTKGPTSSIKFFAASVPSADASELVLGLDPLSLPLTLPKFPYEYLLGDSTIIGIPILQDKIHDEQVTVKLIENTDYEVEFGTAVISFMTQPPSSLWAKDNLLNLETPYNNFGYLMEFYDQNTPEYLKAVKGLWYAYWTGPKPENMRRALYLLFGLPAASKPGTVTGVTLTTISLTYTDGTAEDFAIPIDLNAVVSIGDSVTIFQPLVDGIKVFDKVNSPGFLEHQVGRPGVAPFLTEDATLGTGPGTDETKALKTIEQNTYLPQISVNAFISPNINIGNVQTFLKNIQPKSRTYLFQVIVGEFDDLLNIEENLELDITFDVTPNVDYNPNTEVSQSDLNDAETDPSTGIILDSDGFTLYDNVEVDVYQSAVLIDTFTVQG